MALPIHKKVQQQYDEFIKVYQSFGSNPPSDLEETQRRVCSLLNSQSFIVSNCNQCSRNDLPDRMTPAELIETLKMRMVYLTYHDFQPELPSGSSSCSSSSSSSSSMSAPYMSSETLSSSSSSSSSSMSSSLVKGRPSALSGTSEARREARVSHRVGFENGGANCWVAALLQMFVPSDRREILEMVGTFYKANETLNAYQMQNVLAIFNDGFITDDSYKQGLLLFNRMDSIYYKLLTLRELSKSTIPSRTALIAKLIATLPEPYKKTIEKQKDVLSAIEDELKKEKSHEIDQQKNRQTAGKYLLEALYAYDYHGARNQSIPGYISQNVRQAFHYLFVDPRTGRKLFSKNSSTYADAQEAIQCMMSRYEEIIQLRPVSLKQAFPDKFSNPDQSPMEKHYTKIVEKRVCAPTGSTYAPALGKAYSSLGENNTSSETITDYQIIVTVDPEKPYAPIENYLAQYFCGAASRFTSFNISTY